MEKIKLINLIAAIASIVSVAVPAFGYNSAYDRAYWILGFFLNNEGAFFLPTSGKPEDAFLYSLSPAGAIAIIFGAVVLLLSLNPKFKLPLFTMIGWIATLAGCGLIIVFGFTANIDGPMFLWPTLYPAGIFGAFAGGGLSLVSWIMQTVKR